MTDNQLIMLFLPIIQAGLTTFPQYSSVVVKQSNQPTMQGVNSVPTVYFFKVGDPKRYGFINLEQQITNTGIIRLETQAYETTFQMSALVRQDPTNPGFTASDLINDVSMILSSQDTIDQLIILSNVGILRITEVENPYFMDDRDQHEAAPFFTFTLTHFNTRVVDVNILQSVEGNFARV